MAMPDSANDQSDLVPVVNNGRVVIQAEAPAWFSPSAWISIDQEHAIDEKDWP
jgi:hypothetical protein